MSCLRVPQTAWPVPFSAANTPGRYSGAYSRLSLAAGSGWYLVLKIRGRLIRQISSYLLHFFFKSKEIIVFFGNVSRGFIYLMWVFVLRIKKFYNLETTTIYIKMNVSLIVIRGMRLPNSCFRM